MKIERVKLKRFVSKHLYLSLFVLTVLVGVLSVLPFALTGKIYAGDDLPFHINRIKDMLLTFQGHRLIPTVNFSTFSRIGLGVNLFYPWLTSAFFALLRLLISNPVVAIYSGLGIISMLTFVSSYWSMQKFAHNRRMAVLFSLLYTFSIYRVVTMITRFDIGELGAMIVLPIAMYTFYECVFSDEKNWILLGLSFGMMLNMHLLSGVILAAFFLGIYLVSLFIHQFKLSVLLKLILSAVVAVLISAMTWVPIVFTTIKQAVYTPPEGNLATSAPTFGNLILASLNNSLDHNTSGTPFSVGILLIIGLIIALFFVKMMDSKWRGVLISAVALLLLSTTLFPWGSLQGTPVNIIQFPFRILQIDTLLLAALTAYVVDKLQAKFRFVTGWSIGVICVLFIAASLSFIGTQSAMKDFSKVKYSPDTLALTSYTLNRNSVDKLDTSWGTTDYMPIKSIRYIKSLYKHEALIGNRKDRLVLTPDKSGNGITMTVPTSKKNEHVDLPVLLYDKSYYKVYVNNKLVKVNRTNRDTIGLNISKKGKHLIKVTYNNILLKVGFIISVISVVISIIGQLILLRFRTEKLDD